uniref:Uncharacterized protein n=1 Tax=Ditylenchus dipsaci TaxID=166011 RepID=A0A915DA15_9BILA
MGVKNDAFQALLINALHLARVEEPNNEIVQQENEAVDINYENRTTQAGNSNFTTSTWSRLSDRAIRKETCRERIRNEIEMVEDQDVQNIEIPRAAKMYMDGAGHKELLVLGDSGKDYLRRFRFLKAGLF